MLSLLHSVSVLLFTCYALLVAAAAGDATTTQSPSPHSDEVFAKRTYFYVGGEYQEIAEANGTLRVGQMYVEKLAPIQACENCLSLVFWEGAAQTATNWLNTPDGRRGWASYFLQRGYIIYLIDQPQRGRSPWLLSNGSAIYFTVEELESLYTAPQDYKLYPQAYLHTQFPGTGLRGDPIFDEFYASQIQYQANLTITAYLNQAAGAALFNLIGPAILITHSQSGELGWPIADSASDLVRAVLAIEPAGPPFNNTGVQGNAFIRPWGIAAAPLTYSPPISSPTELTQQVFPPTAANLSSCIRQAEPARQLVNLAKMPVMVMTSPASYHAGYDYCTVAYLEQAGVNVQFVELASRNITGNGHFMFLEKNNLDIAEIALGFFESVGS